MILWDVQVNTIRDGLDHHLYTVRGVRLGSLNMWDQSDSKQLAMLEESNGKTVVRDYIIVTGMVFILGKGIQVNGPSFPHDTPHGLPTWNQWTITPHGQVDAAVQRPATGETPTEARAGGIIPPQRTVH